MEVVGFICIKENTRDSAPPFTLAVSKCSDKADKEPSQVQIHLRTFLRQFQLNRIYLFR